MIEIKKILIIQTAFLGDVILSLPMVQSLKNELPKVRIDYLCIPSTINVLQNNPCIDNIIIYDKKARKKLSNLFKIISKIKLEKYDAIVCPHRSFRSALITHLSGAKIKIGFNKNSLSFLLTHKAKYNPNEHEINRNIELLKQFSEIDHSDKNMVLKPDLFPNSNDKDLVEKLLLGFTEKDSNNLISIAPCSKWFTKQMPEAKSIELINTLLSKGYKTALIGGDDNKDYCFNVQKQVSSRNLINLAGKLTPLQSSYVISKSKILITVDSAAAHLGASTNTPIVMIYGSTLPKFGFYPLTSKNIIIENNNLSCRPCTDHGRGTCPEKHFKCMVDLKISEVVNAAETLNNS